MRTESKESLNRRLDAQTCMSPDGDGSHRMPVQQDDYGPNPFFMWVDIDDQPVRKNLQEVQWFLEHDAWESDVTQSCDVPLCITHLELKNVPKDEDLLALVQSDNKVSLAQLYQRGRQKGLISARSSGY